MKTTALIIFYTVILGAAGVVFSQPTTEYTANRIGVGSNNILLMEAVFGTPPPGSGMLAVGYNNQTGVNNSVAIGSFNKLRQQFALAVGHANTVGELGSYVTSSVAIGQLNNMIADSSLIVGRSNTMYYDTGTSGASSSLIVGEWNFIEGKYSMAVGKNNSIPKIVNGSSYSSPSHTTVLGSGLISRHDNCTVIGKNNFSQEPTIPPSERAPLLVVGNGTSTSARANALEVFDNGDIIITKPQGDIAMGIYGE